MDFAAVFSGKRSPDNSLNFSRFGESRHTLLWMLQFELYLDHTIQTSYWHTWACTHVRKMILNAYNLVYHAALTQETVFHHNEIRKTGQNFSITLRQLIKGAHSNHWNHIICIVSRHISLNKTTGSAYISALLAKWWVLNTKKHPVHISHVI